MPGTYPVVNASAREAIELLAALGGAGAGLILRDSRLRYAGLAAGLVAAALLVWATPRFDTLRGHPAEAAGLVVAALGGLGGLAAAMYRWPRLVPVLVVLALPLRVPVEVGGDTSSLLLPLYGVIASALVAAAMRSRELGWPASRAVPRSILLVERLLAAVVALYALQALYSLDVKNAVENAAFFYVPFAVLYAVLRDLEWTRELIREVLVVLAAAAAVLAAVGAIEYATRDLLLNADLRAENALHIYFRVNSLFRDPNIFGRYLALALIALAGFLAWEERPRRALAAAGVAVLLLLGLALSFSLTSFAALLAGLLVLTWARLGTRVALGAVAAAALAAGASTSLRSARTARRFRAAAPVARASIKGGLDLARDRPVWGFGSGSFGEAFYTRIEKAKTTASHDTPIAVAAEQGIIGLAVYAGLVIGALLLLFGGGVRGSPARATVAALFVAMLVHSLGYASFLEDPATWAILAAGVALQRRSIRPGGGPDLSRCPTCAGWLRRVPPTRRRASARSSSRSSCSRSIRAT